MSMREDIKAAWVADLRNPDNKQGNGVLKNEWGEYCCLGRLCEVLIKDFGFDITIREDKSENGEIANIWYGYKGEEDYELLPDSLAKELGIDKAPQVSYEEEDGILTVGELADMNDSGHTFMEIADIIENGDL